MNMESYLFEIWNHNIIIIEGPRLHATVLRSRLYGDAAKCIWAQRPEAVRPMLTLRYMVVGLDYCSQKGKCIKGPVIQSEP